MNDMSCRKSTTDDDHLKWLEKWSNREALEGFMVKQR